MLRSRIATFLLPTSPESWRSPSLRTPRSQRRPKSVFNNASLNSLLSSPASTLSLGSGLIEQYRPDSFILRRASDKCKQEKRKTINGDDLLWAMGTLGFDRYLEPLKTYLTKYREVCRFCSPVFMITLISSAPSPITRYFAPRRCPSSSSPRVLTPKAWTTRRWMSKCHLVTTSPWLPFSSPRCPPRCPPFQSPTPSTPYCFPLSQFNQLWFPLFLDWIPLRWHLLHYQQTVNTPFMYYYIFSIIFYSILFVVCFLWNWTKRCHRVRNVE